METEDWIELKSIDKINFCKQFIYFGISALAGETVESNERLN